jgi:hypothetical protein
MKSPTEKSANIPNQKRIAKSFDMRVTNPTLGGV